MLAWTDHASLARLAAYWVLSSHTTMILSRKAFSSVRGASLARRSLSSRASTILSALDIPTSTEISGVYDGEWKGTGDVFESKCPTTGEILARVQSVSCTSSIIEACFECLVATRQLPKSSMMRLTKLGRHTTLLGTFLPPVEEKF